MAEQKTGLEGSSFPRIHGLQRTLSFLSCSLSISLSSFSLSLSLFLSALRSRSLTHTLPPYLYLTRSHLFVAGLGMLSWDSAAGSRGERYFGSPFGVLVDNITRTIRCFEIAHTGPHHVRHTQRTIIPSSALGCSRPPPISVCEATRARSLSLSLPLSLARSVYLFLSPSLSSHVTVVTVRRMCSWSPTADTTLLSLQAHLDAPRENLLFREEATSIHIRSHNPSAVLTVSESHTGNDASYLSIIYIGNSTNFAAAVIPSRAIDQYCGTRNRMWPSWPRCPIGFVCCAATSKLKSKSQARRVAATA